MSTKDSICFDDVTGVHLFEEVSLDNDFESPAYIQSNKFSVEIMSYDNEPSTNQVTLEIPAQVMDKLAIMWCRKRKLHSALGGPVGKEYGAPEYDD